MTKKLEGKTAIITGGTEGIGFATAKLFVDEGAYVFITGRRPKELDEAVKAIGRSVTGVQGDVAKLADLDRLYETVAKVKGRIDVVFANAGVGEFVPSPDTSTPIPHEPIRKVSDGGSMTLGVKAVSPNSASFVEE